MTFRVGEAQQRRNETSARTSPRTMRSHCLFVLIGCLPLLSPRFFHLGGIKFASSFLVPAAVPFTPRSRCFRPTHKKQRLEKTCVIPAIETVRQLKRQKRVALVATSNDDDDTDFVQAEDLESLQALFAKYCDSDGLMTKISVMQIPVISELMTDGDLLAEEFNDIWDKAPKFPDVEASDERIDVDSFVQIYRDIDDMFDDEEDEDSAEQEAETVAKTEPEESPSSISSADADEGSEKDVEQIMEDELEAIFKSICDKDGLISKDSLKAWDEVGKLLKDGLLGMDEFEDLWNKTKKSPGSPDLLDVDGFLSFNVALDSLFEFEEDEIEDDVDDSDDPGDDTVASTSEPASTGMVEGDDLSPIDLFASLSNSDGFVGRNELKRWSELEEMLADGDLLQSELDNILERFQKSGRLDEAGFVALYKTIDDLFEDDEDGESDEAGAASQVAEQASTKKEDLLRAMATLNSDEERLPCGLESTDREEKLILNLVEELEREPSNIIRQKKGAVEPSDLAGTWDLLYSSSSAMKFNKGLSGLGGSFPNGRFGRLQQKLEASKYAKDVEYIEHIDVNPSSASFDVKVTGDWDLRTSVSLFTGEPSIVMSVEPGRVTYGPTSTRADHWKSLGPMNMLDVSYLDEDLRIMRGNTSVETIFIFRRSSS